MGARDYDLGTTVLSFPGGDVLTARDLIEGTFITGGIGAGKSSGSGNMISRAMLAKGYGGIILTATAEEKRLWFERSRATGREKSLIVFGPGQPWRFDFLRYETERPGAGARQTENIVKLFTRLAEADQGSQGQGNESFWQKSLEALLRSTVDLLLLAWGRVSLQEMYDLVTSAPQSNAELHSPEWQQRSFCYRSVQEAETKKMTPGQARDLHLTASYWLNLFPNTAEKTRSIYVASFTSIADALMRGVIRDLFSGGLNIVPEMSEQGAIILLDIPVSEYGYTGQVCQVLFKEVWQRAMARRDTKRNGKPVFLWCDECQYFLSANDRAFQNTARHARCATVYLTQNLPNLFSAFPGRRSEDEAKALVGCMGTKIWHANSCPTTNEFAATVIGKTWIERDSWNTSSPTGGQACTNIGGSMQFEYQVPPEAFTSLRSGGPSNNFEVDAYVFQSNGRTWSQTGKPWMRVTFSQK